MDDHLLRSSRPRRHRLAALAMCAAACTGTQQPGPPDARAARLHAAGPQAPLVLFPVRVLGRSDANVADVLGLTLERRGMSALDVAAGAFEPGDATWADVPARFAAHVRAVGGDRDALYAEFLGDPRSGPTEVRFVVVDRAGEILVTDRQTPADAAFRRTAAKDPDPLGCSELVAARLFELAGWQAVPGGVRDGRFAARWQEKSGSPDARERAAMQQRLAALRAGLATATFEALPPVGDADCAAAAQRFAKELQRALQCKSVSASETGLAVAPNNNQQKRLWDLARAAKQAIVGRAPAADYLVAVDAAVGGGGRGYANIVVLTGAGEVVLADFQNDQHPLFQQRRPETRADAEALAVARLAALLR